MRENEFEKGVQQKMEGFHLSPSAEVWVEVEQRIRKEKKQRFIFWWFLGLVVIGGGLALLLFIGNKRSSVGITQNKTNTQPGIPQPDAKKNGASFSTIALDSSELSIEKENNRTVAATNESIQNFTSKPVTIPEKRPVKPAIISARRETPLKNEPEPFDTVATIDKSNDKKGEPPAAIIITTETISMDTIKADPIAVEIPAPEKKDSAVAEQPIVKKEKRSKKWDWGIAASGGRASIVDGFLGDRMYADALGSGGSPVSTPGGSFSLPRHASVALSLGIFTQKPISRKLDIRFGLDYRYLSTKMKTGNKVDSGRIVNNYSGLLQVNNFYRPGDTRAYTNQYHFLGLSASISWKIFDGKKFKLSWNNGINYSYLFNSTMLHYSPGLGGFYKDNRLLRKDHLSVSTEFSIPVSRKLAIGPYASYTLTPVLKEGASMHTNFIDYGIRLRFLLNKK